MANRFDLTKKEVYSFLPSILGVAIGAVSQLALSLVISNKYAATGAGSFYIGLTLMIVLSMVARLGADAYIVRETAPLASEGKLSEAAAFIKRFHIHVLSVSVLFGSTLFSSAGFLNENIFNAEGVDTIIRLFALGLIFDTTIIVFAETLKSFSRPGTYFFLKNSLFYLLALSFILLFGEDSVVSAALLAVYALGIAVVIAAIVVRQKTGLRYKQVEARFDKQSKTLLMTGGLLSLTVIANRSFEWIDSLQVSGILGARELGLYNAGYQISFAIVFLLLAMNALNSARFSRLIASNNMKGLEKTAQRTSLLTMLVSLPIGLFIIWQAEWLLGFFGAEFQVASGVVILLAIAQMLNSSTGSVGYLLLMSKNESAMLKIILTTNALNILLNFYAIPRWGINGAALVSALSIIVKNGWFVVTVRQKLGIRPTVFA